jgi:hypothetical protein
MFGIEEEKLISFFSSETCLKCKITWKLFVPAEQGALGCLCKRFIQGSSCKSNPSPTTHRNQWCVCVTQPNIWLHIYRCHEWDKVVTQWIINRAIKLPTNCLSDSHTRTCNNLIRSFQSALNFRYCQTYFRTLNFRLLDLLTLNWVLLLCSNLMVKRYIWLRLFVFGANFFPIESGYSRFVCTYVGIWMNMSKLL